MEVHRWRPSMVHSRRCEVHEDADQQRCDQVRGIEWKAMRGTPVVTSARFGTLPPLLSGVLTRFAPGGAPLKPGLYESALGDFNLSLRQFDLVATVFALRGLFEWRVAAVASVVLSRGDIVFEGGAQMGTETLFYCTRVGPGGKVISFEADATIAEALRGEVSRQGFTQCTVMAKALGPRVGEALFDVASSPGQNSGLGSLAPDEAPATDRITVEVATLDDAFAEHGRPALVVMDIQGGELGAIRGGRRVLAEARPVMIIEVESGSLARLGGSAEELHEMLLAEDYDCWRMTRFGLRRVHAPHADELGDWLVLPRERTDGLLRKLRTALLVGALTPPRSRFSPFALRRRPHAGGE